MPYITTAGGLNFQYPTDGTQNWGVTMRTTWNTISAHDHTGSGNGTQISASALATNAVTGAKFRLSNNEYLRARNAAGSADVNILRVNSSNELEFALNVLPAGVMVDYGGTSAPSGWLLCNGAAVSRTTYAALFTAISTTYGVGDGSTTFNIPDRRGKFSIGLAASGTGSTLGGTGGSIDHTHSVPAHYHGMGTGADLNITSGGAHTHSIDHDHGSTTSGAEAAHTHSIDHNHASFTSSQGDTLTFDLAHAAGSSTIASGLTGYDSGGAFTAGITSQTYPGQDHTHTIDVPALTGTSGAGSSHTHSVDLPNFTGTSGSTAHTHTAGTFSGSIGLVTGGVDGNAAMISGTNNPPFLASNVIIKT